MASSSNSNTARFRAPPLEDLPQEQDPHEAYCSFIRITSELGFVSAIFAGVCIQRSGIIHQLSTDEADCVKLLVLFAGVVGLGANIACIYDYSFLAPRYNYLRPQPQQRRWRRRRAQR